MTFWSSIAIDFRSFRSLENFHFPSVKLRPKRCFSRCFLYAEFMHSCTCPMAETGFTKYQYKQSEVLAVTKPLFWAVS